MPREEASTFQFILYSIWKPGDSNFWEKICLALEESIFQVEWLIATVKRKIGKFAIYQPHWHCPVASRQICVTGYPRCQVITDDEKKRNNKRNKNKTLGYDDAKLNEGRK